MNRDRATSREAILPKRAGNPVGIGAEQGSGAPSRVSRKSRIVPSNTTKTHASINLQIPKNRLHPSRKFRRGVSHEETGGMKPNPQTTTLGSYRVIVTGINELKKSATGGLPTGVLHG